MIGHKRALRYPHLTHVKDVKFGSRSTKKRTPMYRLSWYDKEFVAGESPATNDSVHGEDYFLAFPPKWDTMLKEATFTIPADYVAEIRRQFIAADAIWSDSFPFDTMIREMCLEPAIAHTRVAFGLIADCLYDESTNYFYRGPFKFLIRHMLIYKFWFGQTGHGLLRRNAMFDRLEWMVQNDTCFPNQPEERAYVQQFLDDMTDHERAYDDYHSARHGVVMECETVGDTDDLQEPEEKSK